MANNDIWISRIFNVINDQRGTILRAQANLDLELSGLQVQMRKLEGQRKYLANQLEAMDRKLKDLEDWREDPVVLVKTKARDDRVYHSADDPCGLVGQSRNYSKWLLGEAENRGIEGCRRCGYRVQRAPHRLRLVS